MNERMDELWRQSWVKIHPDDPFHERFDEDKFAELLVGECMNIAYEYDAPKMSGPGMIIAGRIQEHFGVEE